MGRALRAPHGLTWDEHDDGREWRAHARVRLTGKQVLRALVLVVIAFVAMFPAANGSAFATAVACGSFGLAVLALVRGRPPIAFRLDALGLHVGAHPPIAPVADISAVLVERTATHDDRLRVRVGDEVRELQLAERDPVFLRFIAERVGAALALRRERYRD